MNPIKNFFLRPSRYSLDQPKAPQFVDSNFTPISDVKNYPDDEETILESEDFEIVDAVWALELPGQEPGDNEMRYGEIQIFAVPTGDEIYYVGNIFQYGESVREIIGKSRLPLKGGEVYNLNYRGWHEEVSLYCDEIGYTKKDLLDNPVDVSVHSNFYPDLWSWLIEDLSNYNE